LAEIKETKNSYPSPKYITQLLTHLHKSKQQNAVGSLIINYNLEKDPLERADAYSTRDDE
jgi:hypothetical protein